MTPKRVACWAITISVLGLAHVSVGSAQADTLRLPGVAAPVEIVRDRWGGPHICAQSTRDLFFAQGYNAACDRLSPPDLSAEVLLR